VHLGLLHSSSPPSSTTPCPRSLLLTLHSSTEPSNHSMRKSHPTNTATSSTHGIKPVEVEGITRGIVMRKSSLLPLVVKLTLSPRPLSSISLHRSSRTLHSSLVPFDRVPPQYIHSSWDFTYLPTLSRFTFHTFLLHASRFTLSSRSSCL
jgi:hypothetical protein